MTENVKKYIPTRKIGSAGAIGIPLAIIAAWALSLGGVEMPPEVSTALGGVVSTLIGYFVPERV